MLRACHERLTLLLLSVLQAAPVRRRPTRSCGPAGHGLEAGTTIIARIGGGMDLDLTGQMVGVTMTDANLKSAIGLHPKFPLRDGGIYLVFGKVLGHAPIGLWVEIHWVGKPKPPGGVQRFDADGPAYLVQWTWVITMTLHRKNPDPDEWLRRELDGLEEPLT
jgi:hypothetical protein